MFNRTHAALTKIETGFNVTGSVPVVGMFSGSVRFIAGKVQAVVGAIMAAVGFIAQILHSENARDWRKIKNEGVQQLTHGALNALRGLAEAFLGWTVLGSIGLLVYQLGRNEKFAPQFKYAPACCRCHA